MNNAAIFSIWAPDDSPWSRWAKPILFAHLQPALPPAPANDSPRDISWLPAPEEKVAVVMDLPGAEGVVFGIELAARGYRPVPLYNAVPAPFSLNFVDPMAHQFVRAVDVLPIVSALAEASAQLAQIALPPDAPPAFLLDANRQGEGRPMLEGQFDNRSICFTTDFPSATFLQANGIERALLVQRSRTLPQSDLAHVLRRWQDGGLALEQARVDVGGGRQPLEVARPSWYGIMFQRALAVMGLRRSWSGGFGAWIASSAGG